MSHPPGLLGEGGVKFHDHEVYPSLVEVSLSGQDLFLCEASLSSGASECRLALDVCDPARRTWPTFVEELQDKLASFLVEKCLDQRAGVQVRAQNLSSLM